jgi:hypothetical protein
MARRSRVVRTLRDPTKPSPPTASTIPHRKARNFVERCLGLKGKGVNPKNKGWTRRLGDFFCIFSLAFILKIPRYSTHRGDEDEWTTLPFRQATVASILIAFII